MSIIGFLKRLFSHKESYFKKTSKPPENKLSEAEDKKLILTSSDLMQMARKLKEKGEYVRAEQILKDGVKEGVNNIKLWWLLLEIEESLNRIGRAYYCIEKILEMEPENEKALEKLEEIKPLVDKELSYYIEYKMAPEFYKIK
ncbi:hypothetical protein BBF96_09115 [Anoxybacter fermentans]|uniref:Uncharacterized protein n=1 Tax=Anoxybacter fermentans TaxID=1323375 RepID=A0A3S9SYZ9_9FIRM|nr:hypothetical protein [Anoxybacter fermentans]AZR73531.1 hypothetical protein BBF96_09115 [Anoxybacter fermentans]